ncbi:MAG: HAMP domain-containing histidine kinase [candidate division KSB1 bacterium]|nr:HAMP domain-containing histidine kinase [candidate division KSB1 bacterium]MDZ7300450.1 HAMP domain-containing histidine kinase [candidate division KSB1 bacterium]MDZ7309341.1 HAMP domain-containing histidine kinase [candidate division KSB1 bacterium]MDZ7351448.1 HAMP domain-containing histidine kinase [candidate division KSB1 bacterium]MDZ7355807.1 HAMP domain-containing histidine kinase [candidate division KSB1 bacterium]
MTSCFANLPLRWKIAAPMITALVLMLVATSIYFPQRHKQALRQAQNREAQRTAELLAVAVLHVLQERDFGILQSAMESIQRDSNILFLMLFSENGRHLATYNPARLPGLDSVTSGPPVLPAASHATVIAHDIKDQEQKITGRLILGYSTREVDRQTHEYRLVTAMFTLVMLLPGLFFINAIARQITQPISQLQVQMHETITKGSYAGEVRVASRDEVGRLADAFNQMMAELRLRHQHLAESQQKYRALYEKLQELYRLKSIFVADVSHHLRTPLTVIGGEIELVLRQQRSPEKYQEVLHIVADETKQLARVVDNLLTLGKAEAGNLVFMQEGVDLAEICMRQIRQARLLAKARGLHLEAAIANDSLICGDSNRLAEMVFNLLDNAVKYTPQGGTITVTLHSTPDTLVLRVTDTGIGIAAEERDRVFERFYRGNNACAQARGVGLGLAICKSIVEAHGGSIEVVSQTGKGSTFEVRLPRAPDTNCACPG